MVESREGKSLAVEMEKKKHTSQGRSSQAQSHAMSIGRDRNLGIMGMSQDSWGSVGSRAQYKREGVSTDCQQS